MSVEASWSDAGGGRRTGAAGEPVRARPSTHALSAGESAWLAALVCVPPLLAAIVLLGPQLGRTLFAPPAVSRLWLGTYPHPEPTETARVAIALLGPLFATAGVLLLVRRAVPGLLPRLAVRLGQARLIAFVVACFAFQRSYDYGDAYLTNGSTRISYFPLPSFAVAAALALLAALALHDRRLTARLRALARETRVRHGASVATAVVLLVVWLLSAYNTDGTVGIAHDAIQHHFGFWIDEAFAVVAGQAPLVDFHAQYGHVLLYLTAAGLLLLGPSMGALAAIMLTGTLVAMLAVFATLRRIAGSSIAALALFVPFMATSFFLKLGPPDNRYSPANLFSLFPMRYLGPYLLLWLVVRWTGPVTTRRPVLLLAAGGLVAINNPEFGVPALSATIAALLWTLPRWSVRTVARLAGQVAIGVAASVAGVCALTLSVAGALPRFEMLLTFPRIFGLEGFGALAMPPFGTHLVLYVTFCASILLATVRAISAPHDRMLTAALVWACVFGLGTGGYFSGRSHPHVLVDLFSVWGLTIALLAVFSVRRIVARPTRWAAPVELLVLGGVGLMACSLVQLPTPWSQIERLQRSQPVEARSLTAVKRTLRALAVPGEPLAVLLKEGHRAAWELRIRDVTPYANADSMMSYAQWQETVDALRRAGGTQIVLSRVGYDPTEWLLERGFTFGRSVDGAIEMVATR